ncbi:DUF6659 family protein [Nitrosopumilus sp.]|uniref:DUF6659 family protein n=1 Tax=Nitrosopumilus sp. TaxID=2024843 RepID=UPI00247E7D80|nr:DUF6659 family protein [Nitrosopumilus sp.]MCV0411053.1 hypothetical protein [Nitrosopumilus sp.]
MNSEENLDQQRCHKILELPEIRFAGFLDYMGNLIVGDFKSGVIPLKNENERKKMFIEAVLRIRTRQEFDENLGQVEYAAARRKNVVTMTIPLEKKILFIAAEANVDIDKTARKIIDIL